MSKPKPVMELTDEDIMSALERTWGKGYDIKIREIQRKKSFHAIIVFYKITADRDGATEYRVKILSPQGGWEARTRVKF